MSPSRSAPAAQQLDAALGATISELVLLRDTAPEMYADLMRELRKDLLHRRWLAWSEGYNPKLWIEVGVRSVAYPPVC